MYSSKELGLFKQNVTNIRYDKCLEVNEEVVDNDQNFETWLPVLPESINTAYQVLKERLEFDDIESYIEMGSTVLANKHFPKTNEAAEWLYNWLDAEIVNDLKPLVNTVPKRILVISAVILWHVYKLYDGESGRKLMSDRIGQHASGLKAVVIYLLQSQNTDGTSVKIRKYWTLFNLLEEGEMIQPHENLIYERKVGEGLMYYHQTKFYFQRKLPYLNKPQNVFAANRYFSSDEISQAAMFQIKQLVNSSPNSLFHKPYIWTLDRELLGKIKDKIANSQPITYEPIIVSPAFGVIREKLLQLNNTAQEQIKKILIMVVSSLRMNLTAKLELFSKLGKYAELQIKCNFEGNLHAGQMFDSLAEFEKTFQANIRPYAKGYKE